MIHFYNALKAIYKRRRFVRASCMGEDVRILATANCNNDSGDRAHIQIGAHCEILGVLCVSEHGQIKIGPYTTIRAASEIGSETSIEIGDHVIISHHVTIYDNNNHPTDPEMRIAMCESGFSSPLWKWDQSASAPVRIGRNVWIGQYATILKGVTIGEGAVIAASAVVTKSVPPYSIAAGNPAKVVKYLRPQG